MTQQDFARMTAVIDLCGTAGAHEAAAVAKRVRAMPLSPSTRNRRLCVIKAACKYAKQEGLTPENFGRDIDLLPEPPGRDVVLSLDQIGQLIRACPDPAGQAFIAFAAYTGMRQGEVMALKRADVKDGVIWIRNSKTGKPRAVPVVEALKPYLGVIPFAAHKRTLYALFEQARDALGLDGLRYHDLRHYFASILVNNQQDLGTVGAILGHQSTQTTRRYAHHSVEAMRKAMRAITIPSTDGRARKTKAPKKEAF